MTDASKPGALQFRDRIAELQWDRDPTAVSLDQALREAARHEAFRPGMALLVIVRMDSFNPNREQIAAIARTLSTYGRHFDRHIAFVVDSEFHYGAVRTVAECAEPLGLTLMPFRERGPAEQWLLAQLSDSQILPITPQLPPPPRPN